ncbi:hypothetical protein EDD85DRAFT_790266 [Armillaria nabsnona]|nr:hypothetical protein EDD85DRAFT_790266 [Armillaria nabsnona]
MTRLSVLLKRHIHTWMLTVTLCENSGCWILGMALHLVAKSAGWSHPISQLILDKMLCLPGKAEYQPHGAYCVPEGDLRPFHCQVLPPPQHLQAPTSLVLPSEEDLPCSKMIRAPQPPKEPCKSLCPSLTVVPEIDSFLAAFASPSKKQVSVVLPMQGSTTSPPLTRKCQREQEVPLVTSTPKPNMRGKPTRHSALTKKEVPTPSKSKGAVKKPVLVDPSSDSDPGSTPDGEEYDANGGAAVFGDEDEESDEVTVPLVKRFRKMTVDASSPPPPHAYHPLTGEPLTGLLYVSLTAPAAPAPPLPPAEFSSKAKGKEKAIAPSSPVSLSLHSCAVCNKRSPPRSSKDRRKANRSPIASGSKVVAAATPTASLEAAPVDNTIYVRAFHLQVDLQFHEPPSCQALEYMKLLMLPLAPDSLTNLPCLATIVLCLGTPRSVSLRVKLERRSAVDARLVAMVPALCAGMPINFAALPPFWTLSLLVVMELSAVASTVLSASMLRLLYLVG